MEQHVLTRYHINDFQLKSSHVFFYLFVHFYVWDSSFVGETFSHDCIPSVKSTPVNIKLISANVNLDADGVQARTP